MNKSDIANQQSDFVLYTSNDGAVNVEVVLKDETVWLTQKAMAGLFGVNVPAISKHLANIYETGELRKESTISILETVQKEGDRNVRRKMEFYNLDAIIAVGYRVNSYQATQFRIWATKTLKDQKITDIYALAADYDINAPVTNDFFTTVQNKLHWAITGKTAAEIIYDSADATKIHMGLTGWKHAPDGKILKSDVAIAKNYLGEAHIKELNQIVSAYLDLAENRAQRQILMKMEDWSQFLHGFLELSEYPILKDKGRVSALEAKLKAEQEYEEYRIIQDRDFLSDFDKEIKRIKGEK